MYENDGYIMLHSGRPVPSDGEATERNEGVGIALDPIMTVALRHYMETSLFETDISSMKLNRASGRSLPVYVTIISANAPTNRLTQEKKYEFYARLRSMLASIQDEDVVMLLGDCNARVGSGERVDNNPME